MNPSTSRFADVAHQTLSFDRNEPVGELVMDLLASKWVQRLRRLRQTGNTNLVYMFAEHSRFGHSLGVAYLATLLMKNLARNQPEEVREYALAVTGAALLHDLGHIAPGSHLAERVWMLPGSEKKSNRHETISKRVISEDPEIRAILQSKQNDLPETINKILDEDKSLPSWTHQIISGGGWNADRGNWAIVDSSMCSVKYGHYNVTALLDSFCISPDGQLVLHENRLDALTHFYVARDSMYRQVYQHRVLQAADSLCINVVKRLRDLQPEKLKSLGVYTDKISSALLEPGISISDLSLESLFGMDENWWFYHLSQWMDSEDKILADLSDRIVNRRLFKTIRVYPESGLLESATSECIAQDLPPEYYLNVVGESDSHRETFEEPPKVILDNGELKLASEVEPLIDKLIKRAECGRQWIAVPPSVKEALGATR